MRKLLVLLLALPGLALARNMTMDGPMTDGNAAVGQAYQRNFNLNTDDQGIDNIAIQVTYSSGAYSASTFTDGNASTGSLTVVTYTALSSATASAKLTIVTNSSSALDNTSVYTGGVNLLQGTDWNYNLSYASMTAASIAAAIARNTVFLSTCNTGATGIVYSTAPAFGTSWNSYGIGSSTVAMTGASFAGGQDNATVMLGTVTLRANTHWYPLTSTTVTAASLASAINSYVTGFTATAIGAVVTATSTAVGTSQNVAIVSSSQTALTVNGTVTTSNGVGTGSMYGGTNSAWTIGQSTFPLAAHGYPTGLAMYVTVPAGGSILYSTTAVGGVVSNLATGSTVYATPVTANIMSLATTSTGAVAGVPFVFRSSNTKATTDTFSLGVTSTTMNGFTYAFWAGNDGNNYTQIISTITPSISGSTYIFPSTSTFHDIGAFDWKWLQMRVTPPAGGATILRAHVHGEQR